MIDWHSFSIGNDHTVVFNNGSGATLNRVTGGDPSVIDASPNEGAEQLLADRRDTEIDHPGGARLIRLCHDYATEPAKDAVRTAEHLHQDTLESAHRVSSRAS